MERSRNSSNIVLLLPLLKNVTQTMQTLNNVLPSWRNFMVLNSPSSRYFIQIFALNEVTQKTKSSLPSLPLYSSLLLPARSRNCWPVILQSRLRFSTIWRRLYLICSGKVVLKLVSIQLSIVLSWIISCKSRFKKYPWHHHHQLLHLHLPHNQRRKTRRCNKKKLPPLLLHWMLMGTQ